MREFTDWFPLKAILFCYLLLPAYDPDNRVHQELARLSRQAHAILARTGGTGDITVQRTRINELVNTLLRIQ